MPDLTIVAEPDSPTITTSREVAAPPDVVFRAFTDADLLPRWLGPHGYTMEIDELDVRHGGRWRYVHRDPQGQEFAFRGVFHGEPSPDNGYVQTWEWEGTPGHVALETLSLIATEHGTRIATLSVYQSVADRDAMVASGMADGMEQGYDRLDALLTERVEPS